MAIPLETPAPDTLAHPDAPRQALLELRRLSGLTWDQMARLFGVNRPQLLAWASGQPAGQAATERLNRLLKVVRYVDRGSAEQNRLALCGEGDLLFDGPASDTLDAVKSRLGQGPGRRDIRRRPLSPQARAARRPLPPEVVTGQLDGCVHTETGRRLAALSSRNRNHNQQD